MTLARPFFKWLIFAACIGLFLVAMVWISQRTLAMDRARETAERERLALWRMDSLVGALLIRENSRPTGHYQAFRSPDDLFDNRTQREVAKGQTVTPSPLLGQPPEFVRLHFEARQVSGQVQFTSPQVPTGNDLVLANTWFVVNPQMEVSKQRLQEVQRLHEKHTELLSPSSVGAASQKLKENAAKLEMSAPSTAPAPAMAKAIPQTEAKPVDIQIAASGQELQKRAIGNVFNLSKDTLTLNNAPQKKIASSAPKPTAAINLREKGAYKQVVPQEPPVPAPATAVTPTTLPSDLKPLWVGDELFLLRTVTIDGQSVVQGLWLDWPALRTRLLSTIGDLLPQAALLPTAAAMQDASSFATLPVRLLPGAVQSVGTSPLQRSLFIAWACFLIAAVAVGVVLHSAMVLSERRGAFVSAVTHELRTPLTTFQLYSEMLADDMVPDANQRREYLRTLCDESTRLTHLVENVLSYSRIERGRTAARREQVKLGVLIARIEPRLRQRTQPSGLDLQVQLATEAADTLVNVDALAVEQIVFNLVDNACKYAAPASTEPTLNVEVKPEGAHIAIRVRDHGPGFAKAQLKRLFMPFEKSATEAAHSAPGVGLGLALCRRLARELCGDLVLESSTGGACFRLTMPMTH
jgi:signal transduction histidine kinase